MAMRAASIVVITIVHAIVSIVIPILVSHDPFLPFRNVWSRGHAGTRSIVHTTRNCRLERRMSEVFTVCEPSLVRE